MLVLVAVFAAGCASEAHAPADTSGAIAAATSTSTSTTIARPTIAPPTTIAETTTVAPATIAPTTAASSATSATPTTGTTPYGVPIGDGVDFAYAHEHNEYRASDVFAGGCDTRVISPVDGTLLEVRRENRYDPATDNPALRGGRSVAVLGDDGVRYYFAHFETIDDVLVPGNRIGIGDPIGRIGRTGRAGACHLHFGISPPCPGREWSVRRGVISPWPYLDAWRRGEQLSPRAEIDQWVIDNPDACANSMADPHAGDA